MSLIWVGIADGRPEYPQKEWTKVATENLVVAIAEPQLTGFNVQRCRKIPSKAPERRHEGVASAAFPGSFLTLVEVTITDTTAGSPSGYLFHEANFCSGDLRVSAWMHKRSLASDDFWQVKVSMLGWTLKRRVVQ